MRRSWKSISPLPFRSSKYPSPSGSPGTTLEYAPYDAPCPEASVKGQIGINTGPESSGKGETGPVVEEGSKGHGLVGWLESSGKGETGPVVEEGSKGHGLAGWPESAGKGDTGPVMVDGPNGQIWSAARTQPVNPTRDNAIARAMALTVLFVMKMPP